MKEVDRRSLDDDDSSPGSRSLGSSASSGVSTPATSSTATATSQKTIYQDGGDFSASLERLGLSIPSHQQFSVMVHKHEVPRKVLHVSIGFLTLWLYTIGVQFEQVTPVLLTLFVGIGTCDLARFQYPAFNKLYIKVLGFLMREKEVRQFNGVIWYLLGLVIVTYLFPKDVSLLAVLLLSWADTAASTFGRAYGYLTPKIGSKSLAGSMAAYLVGCVSCWLLYSYFIPNFSQYNRPDEIMWHPETSTLSLKMLVALAGLVGAASEAIDIFDDNLTIPVLSSSFMWLLIKATSN